MQIGKGKKEGFNPKEMGDRGTSCTVIEGRFVVLTQIEGFLLISRNTMTLVPHRIEGGTEKGSLVSQNSRIINALASRGWVIEMSVGSWCAQMAHQLTHQAGENLSAQVCCGRQQSWAPHSSVLPSRKQRRKWTHTGPAEMQTGCEEGLNFQCGGPECLDLFLGHLFYSGGLFAYF